MRRAVLVLCIVVGLGALAWVAAAKTGMLGPDDGLDCPSNTRGSTTSDYAAGTSSAHARSPDDEIERSDLWSFYDIPRSAWHLVAGDITPENGIVRVEPLVETNEERAEYVVYVDGSGVLRATVVPFDDRYVLAGWTTC
jgi:hypothetical protein